MTNKDFITFDTNTKQFNCHGEWTLLHLATILAALKKISWPTTNEIILNAEDISKLDSAGAWLLSNETKKLLAKNIKLQLRGLTKQHQQLISIVENQKESVADIPKVKKLTSLGNIGKFSYEQFNEMQQYLAFIGKLSIEALRVIFSPARLRFNSIASTIDLTGFKALPIIALLSFMIGVVISYQMGNQLRSYGANVFIVDLLGLSILREFGPLITAIMVAGRTGSAFTAQLGIMKLNQEVDALNTMGISAAELLLLPRIIGLVIALPLLTVWADIFGIFGGMVMSENMLDISWHDFIQRFEHQIPARALVIGLAKAPVFALLIASISCFQGMQVKGSAESVGARTTRSVVLAIFFIIICDAIFSILFSKFGL